MASDEDVASLLRETESFTAAMVQFGYVQSRPVALHPLADALITRTTFPTPETFTGAVYDGERRLVRSSLRLDPQANQPVDPDLAPDDELAAARTIPCAVYGGMLFLILGHFLFESIARLWVQADMSLVPPGRAGRLPVIYHPCPGFDLDVFMAQPLLKDGLASLGIGPENLILATESYRVGLLYYPDTLSIYHEYVHPLMNRVIDFLGDSVSRPTSIVPSWPLRPASSRSRLFLSRARWNIHVRISNEAELEDVFRERGFSIVHPQELGPGEIIRLMRGAEIVASSDGSHAHLLAFARPGTRTLHLDTRPVPTQAAIEKLRGLRAHHTPLFSNPGGIWDEGRMRVDPERLGPLIDLVTRER